MSLPGQALPVDKGILLFGAVALECGIEQLLYGMKLGKEEGGKIKEVPDSVFSMKKISDMPLIGCAITNQNRDIEIKFIEFNL